MDTAAIDALTVAELRRRGGVKWQSFDGDLPASIAEMDFGCAPTIINALESAVRSQLVGYLPEDIERKSAQACADWLARESDWVVAAARIRPLADVVSAYEHAMTTFLPEGGAVIVPTPAWGPFLDLPQAHGLRVIELPLANVAGRWVIDLETLDAAFAGGGALLVMCDPHNPTGTVYRFDELADIADVVDTYGGRVFADAIHAPILYDGARHVPYASVSPAAAEHTVTAVSAAKGWNIAGLKAAQLVLSNDADERVWHRMGARAEHGASTLGVIAAHAAYTSGGSWLRGINSYLRDNRDVVVTRLGAELPIVSTSSPEGTYFAWLDFRAAGLGDNAADHLRESARVLLANGSESGAGGSGFVRLNFATPRPILHRIIDQIVQATLLLH